MTDDILTRGRRGPAVTELQRLLSRRGFLTAIDGVFGEATEKAVRTFQGHAGLVVDGRAGSKTIQALQGGDCTALLQDEDLVRAAARLGLPLATVYAVNEVESLGEGFLQGRVKILFERHQMRRQLLVNRPDLDVGALSQQYPNIINVKTGGYAGGAAEWARFTDAVLIDEKSAIEASSWGAFQIMGYHWQRLGYMSVHDFLAAMVRSESEQFDAFVRFIETDKRLLKALKSRDWVAFASRYNGPAYAKNRYDTKLANAYNRYATCGCTAPGSIAA
ncbi:N-acetylmuramidase family protein [Pseudomonas sp. 21LCFQ010]|uniref:N-acetylmuramidase domain-containing protein n=1 Tax=Pseudomonas sp. 21LCFQ010 TaxID=2957506 RepID=UPI002097D891|nr:N-acetylmuramidase family protein [Pseudomonas sp. 21LCFQ010]MCO8161995.1 N-acetylmuramidase family protein [Pseudomonas sp. 21LCFQ010]